MKPINYNETLLSNRGINSINFHIGSDEINNDAVAFHAQVSGAIHHGVAKLPMNPGFEYHPYKGVLMNQDSSKYIIGTFPPINYLIDTIVNQGYVINRLKQPTHPNQEIDRPQIPFFHGNVSALWSAFLTRSELQNLNAIVKNVGRFEAKEFLVAKLLEVGIYYDDIIACTQRSLGKLKPVNNRGYTYEDTNLENIVPDLQLLTKVLSNLKLETICFTNGATFRSGQNGGLQLFTQRARQGLIKTVNADALSLFLRTCQDVGLNIEIQCLPFYQWKPLHQLTDVEKRTKLIFKLRLTPSSRFTLLDTQVFQTKEVEVITPFSPAAHGKIESHPIVLAIKRTLGRNLTAADVLPHIYSQFRNGNSGALYQFNINQ
jgi:hypothetical protein